MQSIYLVCIIGCVIIVLLFDSYGYPQQLPEEFCYAERDCAGVAINIPPGSRCCNPGPGLSRGIVASLTCVNW